MTYRVVDPNSAGLPPQLASTYHLNLRS